MERQINIKLLSYVGCIVYWYQSK